MKQRSATAGCHKASLLNQDAGRWLMTAGQLGASSFPSSPAPIAVCYSTVTAFFFSLMLTTIEKRHTSMFFLLVW